MYNIGCNGFRYTSTVRDPTCRGSMEACVRTTQLIMTRRSARHGAADIILAAVQHPLECRERIAASAFALRALRVMRHEANWLVEDLLELIHGNVKLSLLIDYPARCLDGVRKLLE